MEEETTLRDLIMVILRGKRIIIGTTIIFILLSIIYSLFLVTPKYEAQAIVMVNQFKPASQQNSGSSLDVLFQNLFRQPEMSLDTYRSQITSYQVLMMVIEELKLDPTKYTIGSLLKEIRTEIVKNTTNISITVIDEDSQNAVLIANSVASNYIKVITAQGKKQSDQSRAFLGDQIQNRKKDLDGAMEDYKLFLSQPKGVQELKSETDAKLRLLTEFKNQLIQNEVERKKVASALNQLDSDLSNTPEKIVLKKNITEDPYLTQVLNESDGKSGKKISGVNFQSEVVNELYFEIAKNRNLYRTKLADLEGQQQQMESNIHEIQQQLMKLQVDLAEKQIQDDRLTQKLQTAKNDYQVLSNRYNEALISQAVKIGEFAINIFSPAVEPSSPMVLRKLANAVLAGICGFGLSIIVVFFLDYWRRSELN